MTPNIILWLKKAKQLTGNPGTLLEVGSLNVNGSVREIYGGASKYVGIDMQPGKDVDMVLNGHDILSVFEANSFDMVVCCETLEHDDQFWVTVDRMRAVVKPGGWMIITNPGTDVIRHNYPGDFYRFFSDAYKYFFRDWEQVLIEEKPHNDAPKTTQIFGLGKKPLEASPAT